MNIDRSPCPAQHLKTHGTYSAYRYGCRCEDAREDARLYHKRRREGRAQPLRVDSTGTRRRIQALVAIGWNLEVLAQKLGTARGAVGDYMCIKPVNASTARRVAAVYNQLSMTPGPSRRAQVRARNKGWVPPFGWDDAEIDDPNAQPVSAPKVPKLIDPDIDMVAVRECAYGRLDPNTLTVRERREVVRLLADVPAPQIALKTGMNIRTIERARKALGITTTSTTTEEAA